MNLAFILDNVKKIGNTVAMIAVKGWPQFASLAVIAGCVLVLAALEAK